MLFLLEHALLAAHQGKTTIQEDKVIWNKFSIGWRHLKIGVIALFRFAPYEGGFTGFSDRNIF